MKSVIKSLALLGAVLLILACGVAAPAPTAVPPTAPPATQAPAPLPPTPGIVGVRYKNVHFTVPFAMASFVSYDTTTDVEFPYINPSAGPMPEHIVFKINGYPREGLYTQPTVLVYPAAEYAQYSELTLGIVNALQGLHVSPGQALPQELISGVISAQVQQIQFQSGYGVRYLTQVNQIPVPINNLGLFYYFQGLTSDGKYYVQVLLPAYTAFLTNDDKPDSPTPPEGIPFDWNDYTGLPQYLEAVTQRLNATAPEAFTPHLTELDKLVQSIEISP